MSRSLRAILVILAALVLAACTETDDIIRQIGVTRLSLVDPSLAQQELGDPKLQGVRWIVLAADLTLAGNTIDLLAGDPCTVDDTLVLLPVIVGRCAVGTVIDAGADPAPASLSLTVRMYARRVEPLSLPPGADFDADGHSNATDLCPLISDPGQEDTDPMDGLGDACQALNPFSQEQELDNDGDGDVDAIDNCVYEANANQEDEMSPDWPEGDPLCREFSGSPINCPDGIGDACTGQTAAVSLNMSADIQLTLDPGGFVQGQAQTTYLTVDFSSADSLTCDWVAGTCSLDPAQVTACVHPDLFSSAAGC